MGNFKLGSKVTCIQKFPYFTEGEVYKIQHIDGDFITLLDDDVDQQEFHIDHFNEKFEVVQSKKQRIETLEKEVSELKLIVHELRERKETPVTLEIDGKKLSTTSIIGNAVEPSTDNSVEDKQADVIEFEGQQYRKVEREAVEGDVVIFTSIPEDESGVDVEEGKPYRAYEGEGLYKKYIKDDTGFTLHIYGGGILRGTTETVDVYEPIVQPVQRQTVPCSAIRPPIEEVGEAFFEAANKVLNPKTANQLRGEVIEKAKAFVENLTEHVNRWGYKNEMEYGVIDSKVGSYIYNVEFVTNEEKRTIVTLLRGSASNHVYSRNKAKCMPNDVYNEHIGKAIALGRALGLDVSEFEQAVQPTIAVGQRIQSLHVGQDHGDPRFSDLKVTSINKFGHPEHDNGMYTSDYNIINDTNAIYGGVE